MNLRKACNGDVVFIANLIKEGSREGHFSDAFFSLTDMEILKYVLVAVSYNRTYIDTNNILKTDVFVYQDYDDVNKGFCWITTNETSKEIEILMLYVVDKFRKKGIASNMINSVTNFYEKNTISARLYRKSEIMLNILLKSGFEKIEHNAKDSIKLIKMAK